MAKDAQTYHNLQKFKNNYQSVQNHLKKNILKISWNPIGRRMPNLHKSKMAATFSGSILFIYEFSTNKAINKCNTSFSCNFTGESISDINIMIQSQFWG